MSTTLAPLAPSAPFLAATRALDAVPCSPESTRSLADAELLELLACSAEHERLARAHTAALAGELARRSAPELGHGGLAQKLGHRTAQKLIQATTGSTSRAASQAVRVGGLTESHPWLATVAAAVADRGLSADAADAIRGGLGMPSDEIPASVLASAAEGLILEAAAIDADRLFLRARAVRDEFDEAGILDRERAAHEARGLRLQSMRDGTVRILWNLDPLDGSVVAELYDRATSPRRGGPRFVTDDEHAQRIADDPRSTEQLASDVFYQLITSGAEGDPSQLLGRGAPAVRVTVTERQLIARAGHGRVQGSQVPVSIETVERLACTQGTVAVAFDDLGQPLDVGREQRLFTTRQRTALAERDGGCRWTGCERPPRWAEAHHLRHWVRDGGRTDVADGILLCKHHHLLLHDHHWEVERRGPNGSEYWLIPPPGHPEPEPRQLMSKSAALNELLAGVP